MQSVSIYLQQQIKRKKKRKKKLIFARHINTFHISQVPGSRATTGAAVDLLPTGGPH